MAKQSQIAAAIEKAEAEIAFQQRLIQELKLAQNTQAHKRAMTETKRVSRKIARVTAAMDAPTQQ